MAINLMKSTVTGGIWRLWALAILILVILLSILYGNIRHAFDTAAEVERTVNIDRELRELEADMLMAETGQRGFLLTNTEQFLQPYHSSRDTILAHIDRLDRLIRHPEARDKLNRLTPLISARLNELDETLSLAKDGALDAVDTRARLDEGKRLMDEIHTLLMETIDLEQRLLTERRARFEAGLYRLIYILGVGGVLSVIILSLTAVRTAKRLKQPVSNLLDGIQAMADGYLDRRVTVSNTDEIGRVAQAFNAMAGNLQVARDTQQAMQVELQRSNAELDSFAYVASHDLKAPLRGIRNLADWISEDLGPDAPEGVLENLRLLHTRVDRLDGLLESLLDYSRIGRMEAAVESVDTGLLVDEIKDYLAPPPGFRITRQPDMPILKTGRPPLEKVLRNLISNAIKHHDRDNGQVDVSVEDIGDWWEFRISDDGPGIPPQFHERVFNIFQTLKSRDHTEGSGMGLAIVKKSVESLCGSIRIESTAQERGTRFIFAWPKVFTQARTDRAMPPK